MVNNIANAELNQVTDTVIMISPDYFQFNDQTSSTNAFQHRSNHKSITKKAILEFNVMVDTLRTHDIRVLTLSSRSDVITPDAVFPNNWFSINRSDNGKNTLVLYPMLVENRRLEKQPIALEHILKKNHITIDRVIDFSFYEKENKALEGTGSLVLDRKNKIAFASISPRTNVEVLEHFANKLGYKAIIFSSYDEKNKLIYHTNVIMSVGDKFSILCDECIKDQQEKMQVIAALKATHKEIISITKKQVTHMAGNILQVESKEKKSKIILSQSAYESLSENQRTMLSDFGELVMIHIPTIEEIGGGSARCMIAEVFY